MRLFFLGKAHERNALVLGDHRNGGMGQLPSSERKMVELPSPPPLS